MAKVKKTDALPADVADAPAVEVVVEQAAEKAGRALIDLPAYELLSGDYATLPADVADALAAIGAFDPNAVEVQE